MCIYIYVLFGSVPTLAKIWFHSRHTQLKVYAIEKCEWCGATHTHTHASRSRTISHSFGQNVDLYIVTRYHFKTFKDNFCFPQISLRWVIFFLLVITSKWLTCLRVKKPAAKPPLWCLTYIVYVWVHNGIQLIHYIYAYNFLLLCATCIFFRSKDFCKHVLMFFVLDILLKWSGRHLCKFI